MEQPSEADTELYIGELYAGTCSVFTIENDVQHNGPPDIEINSLSVEFSAKIHPRGNELTEPIVTGEPTEISLRGGRKDIVLEDAIIVDEQHTQNRVGEVKMRIEGSASNVVMADDIDDTDEDSDGVSDETETIETDVVTISHHAR